MHLIHWVIGFQMTGIPADNNFKDFLKVDLFTLKIWGHQGLAWDWDTLMHRRSLPDRSGILLVLLTCAKILSSTVSIWSRFFRSRLRNFARFVILRLVFISINLRQAVPDACVFNLRRCSHSDDTRDKLPLLRNVPSVKCACDVEKGSQQLADWAPDDQ